MAARALVVADDDDGADRVHVVTGCGFGEVYGTAAGAKGFPSPAGTCMIPRRMTRSETDTEEDGMGFWVRISRSIVMVIGAGALLLAGGNLVTGGGSITDPAMPGGVILGLLALGAGMWTTDTGSLRALVVWLGVFGILAALAIAWINAGEMQTRDLLVYVGIPTIVILAATIGVAVGRARAGALGGSTPA